MVVILKADKENYDSLQSPIPRFKAMASGIGKVRGKKIKVKLWFSAMEF